MFLELQHSMKNKKKCNYLKKSIEPKNVGISLFNSTFTHLSLFSLFWFVLLYMYGRCMYVSICMYVSMYTTGMSTRLSFDLTCLLARLLVNVEGEELCGCCEK